MVLFFADSVGGNIDVWNYKRWGLGISTHRNKVTFVILRAAMIWLLHSGLAFTNKGNENHDVSFSC